MLLEGRRCTCGGRRVAPHAQVVVDPREEVIACDEGAIGEGGMDIKARPEGRVDDVSTHPRRKEHGGVGGDVGAGSRAVLDHQGALDAHNLVAVAEEPARHGDCVASVQVADDHRVGRCGQMWADCGQIVGRCGQMWADVGRCGQMHAPLTQEFAATQ